MLAFLRWLWRDDRGVLTTLEVIGWIVILGGATALAAYALSAAQRGLTARVMGTIQNTAP